MSLSISELTQKLDAAVKGVDTKKVAAEKAKKDWEAAETAYNGILAEVKDLHKQYSAYMDNILTKGGQIHR